MRVGHALNALRAPRDLVFRYRYGAAMKHLRTPEARYERAMRNWQNVHEQTTVERAAETGRRMEPVDAMGVWAG